MRLARLDVTRAQLEALPVLITEPERPLVISVRDADTVTTLAGACARWEGSWGVWLLASAEYPASLIARDVKTLAMLTQIDHVVIDAASNASAHAEVVRALMGADEVNLTNAVTTIAGAYNRPVSPIAIQVWSVSSARGALESEGRVLSLDESSGDVTFFSDVAPESA